MTSTQARPAQLLLCADRRYARALAVALASSLEHAPAEGAAACVVLDGFDAESRRGLERLAAQWPAVEVCWLDASKVDLLGLPGVRHVSAATYLRLFIADLLPDAHRVVYLDADVLVRQSLAPLFALDLRGRAVGAVRDMVIADANHPWYGSALRGDHPYFNAGVLVVDVARWRTLDITARALQLARGSVPAGNIDQDYLNDLLRDEWLELDETWNVQGALLLTHEHPPHPWAEEVRERAPKLLADPAIVHFSAIKPWVPISRHPFRREWQRILRTSGFPGYRRWVLLLTAKRAALLALELLGVRKRRERIV